MSHPAKEEGIGLVHEISIPLLLAAVYRPAFKNSSRTRAFSAA
jgi:hypothetical protein